MIITTVIFISTLILQSSAEVTMKSAVKYLERYGFLKNCTGPVRKCSKRIQEGLRLFQKFAGLKPTGRFDEMTKEKITEAQNEQTNLYDLQEPSTLHKWKKKNLTYSIGSIPKRLSRKAVRSAIRIAFEVWSTVTPLNFTEVPRNGDINIAFVGGKHNDPHAFDGPGKILAHAIFRPHGVVHFDNDEKWAFLNVNDLSRHDTIDLLRASIHEIGHVLGLEHSKEKVSVMSPFYGHAVDANGKYVMPKLTGFDILHIQELYGAKRTRRRYSKDDYHPAAADPGGKYWMNLFKKYPDRYRTKKRYRKRMSARRYRDHVSDQ